MELSNKELNLIYESLVFSVSQLTDDMEDKEMVELYKEDIELLNTINVYLSL